MNLKHEKEDNRVGTVVELWAQMIQNLPCLELVETWAFYVDNVRKTGHFCSPPLRLSSNVSNRSQPSHIPPMFDSHRKTPREATIELIVACSCRLSFPCGVSEFLVTYKVAMKNKISQKQKQLGKDS
ncbi:hypothetical protein Lal_00006270 [Lupinus albus]|nr:hypothetical protein Lal_00006270 [Lupinus albus]